MNRLVKSLFRKKRKNEGAIKYISYLLHLWLGLLSSLIVFVVCLTGAIYAFKTQIIELYNKDKVYITYVENQTIQTPDELRTSLKKQNKDLVSIYIPEQGNRSWIVGYKNDKGESKSTYYNPYTKQELGVGNDDLSQFFSVVLSIHRNLLMGDVGRQIVGAGVLIFVFLLVSGFVLWLPKKWKYLKQNLTIKLGSKFQRLNYDFHNVAGFYAMLMLGFIAITGLYITYPWVKNALIVSLGGESLSNIKNDTDGKKDDAFATLMGDMLNRQKEKTEIEPEKEVSLNHLLQTTQTHFPNSGSLTLELPNDENPRYTIRKINSDNRLGALLPDELTFDKKGELKTKELFLDKPLNKQFTSLAKPLHTGEIMGLPSIILYFIVSFIGCLLPITGFLIWWHRLRKMKK
ncbi:MAG: PepSY-associated TM helix domain-containing protein [Bergeyella zoohelcum]|nr:PepSY-associated TM helix domain-containing protein [Bergeyella zoohelcum]